MAKRNVSVYSISKSPIRLCESTEDGFVVPEGMMVVEGVLAVCGTKNANRRIYSVPMYKSHIAALQPSINEGLLGEYEHPKVMTVNRERASHRVLSVSIDESTGAVTGKLLLLDTPLGLLCQSIVRAGCPLYPSSRATGSVDESTGQVNLTRLYTYDLVNDPGFKEAKMKLPLNESLAESDDEMITIVAESEEKKSDGEGVTVNAEVPTEVIDAKLAAMKSEMEDKLSEAISKIRGSQIQQTVKISESLEKWVFTDVLPSVQAWIQEEFGQVLESKIQAKLDQLNSTMEGKSAQMASRLRRDILIEAANSFGPIIQEYVTEASSVAVNNLDITMDESAIKSVVQEMVAEDLVPKFVHEGRNGKDFLASVDAALATVNESTADLQILERTVPSYLRHAWAGVPVSEKMLLVKKASMRDIANEAVLSQFWTENSGAILGRVKVTNTMTVTGGNARKGKIIKSAVLEAFKA